MVCIGGPYTAAGGFLICGYGSLAASLWALVVRLGFGYIWERQRKSG